VGSGSGLSVYGNVDGICSGNTHRKGGRWGSKGENQREGGKGRYLIAAGHGEGLEGEPRTRTMDRQGGKTGTGTGTLSTRPRASIDTTRRDTGDHTGDIGRKAYDDEYSLEFDKGGRICHTGLCPWVGGTGPSRLASARAYHVLQRCLRASCRPTKSPSASSPTPTTFLGLLVPRRFGAKGPAHHILSPSAALDSHTHRNGV
jgi:hypothetical protein